MAERSFNPLARNQQRQHTQKRSAMGVGVTSLVTILVVLLLAAFSILSLVSARSNLGLAEISAQQTQAYYTADSEATLWYGELDAFTASLGDDTSGFAEQLTQAGYEVNTTAEGEVRVTQGFTINENRTLMVTVAVNDDTTTTIRQWQS